MTDITLEQRARELLAAEHRKCERHAEADLIEADNVTALGRMSLNAIEAALRLPAGADWQPIETAPLNLDDVQLWDGGDVMVGYYAHGRWYGRAGSTGEMGVVHPTHWKPQTAAPRHETGEGA